MADYLRAKGLLVIGCTKKNTLLEQDKLYCKRILTENKIPTARLLGEFNRIEELDNFLSNYNKRVVIKFNWLTINGDGAIILNENYDKKEVLENCKFIYESNGDKFTFFAEEFIGGYDYSSHYLVNGEDYIVFPTALDYKKSDENNKGKNCDGMGTISPHINDDDVINEKIESIILKPLLKGLKAQNKSYTGFIFLGLRVSQNKPYLLEINTRFGDSEAEVVYNVLPCQDHLTKFSYSKYL